MPTQSPRSLLLLMAATLFLPWSAVAVAAPTEIVVAVYLVDVQRILGQDQVFYADVAVRLS